jgi:acetoacetyl-CoA synthetase
VSRRKPQPLWEPDEAFARRTRLRAYGDWLSAYHGVEVATYDDLWEWSIGDLEGFWSSIAEYFGVRFHDPPQEVLGSSAMPGAQWFTGATLSYPEHIFGGCDGDAVAIRHASELRSLETMTWAQLRTLTARIQAGLRRPRRRLVELLAGLRRPLGDRPLRADRAHGAARGGRLPLRRA